MRSTRRRRVAALIIVKVRDFMHEKNNYERAPAVVQLKVMVLARLVILLRNRVRAWKEVAQVRKVTQVEARKVVKVEKVAVDLIMVVNLLVALVVMVVTLSKLLQLVVVDLVMKQIIKMQVVQQEMMELPLKNHLELLLEILK